MKTNMHYPLTPDSSWCEHINAALDGLWINGVDELRRELPEYCTQPPRTFPFSREEVSDWLEGKAYPDLPAMRAFIAMMEDMLDEEGKGEQKYAKNREALEALWSDYERLQPQQNSNELWREILREKNAHGLAPFARSPGLLSNSSMKNRYASLYMCISRRNDTALPPKNLATLIDNVLKEMGCERETPLTQLWDYTHREIGEREWRNAKTCGQAIAALRTALNFSPRDLIAKWNAWGETQGFTHRNNDIILGSWEHDKEGRPIPQERMIQLIHFLQDAEKSVPESPYPPFLDNNKIQSVLELWLTRRQESKKYGLHVPTMQDLMEAVYAERESIYVSPERQDVLRRRPPVEKLR